MSLFYLPHHVDIAFHIKIVGEFDGSSKSYRITKLKAHFLRERFTNVP